MEPVLLGLLWYIVFINSIVFHEFAHGFISLKLGDRTAHDNGLVTLIPYSHMRREILGTIVIPIASFILGGWMIGWASTPYDYHWAQRYPKRSALVAISGPLANLVLVVISGLIVHVGYRTNIFYAPNTIDYSWITGLTQNGDSNPIITILSIIFSLNLILFVLNLLPVPPFDGSKIILFFLDQQHVAKAMDILSNPMLSLVGVIIMFSVFGFIFHPIWLESVSLLYPGIRYYSVGG